MEDKCDINILVPNPKPRSWKKHYGAVAKLDGEFFVSPGIIGMGDKEAIFCLSFDSVRMVAYKGKHVLAPVSWLRENGKDLRALDAFESWLEAHWDAVT